MFRSHGGDVKSVWRIFPDEWNELIASGDAGRRPLLISGLFKATTAVRTWTPASISARFADEQFAVSVSQPGKGGLYHGSAADHLRRMSLGEFVDQLPNNPGSYLAQARMNRLSGLADDLAISQVVGRPFLNENLWMGNATRSGLHFDEADNLLAQVYGVETATLVPPGQFSCVYPRPELHTKSQVDPDDIDARAFPRFAQADRYTATLHPGDALYIPRLWWHHLASDDISISVNAWFGQMYRGDLPATVLRAGPTVWRRVGRDFVALGILKRDYQNRLFSPKPTGLRLYEMLTGSTRR